MKKKKKFKKHILKVFSVIAAIFLWVYVIGSSDIEVEKVVPVVWQTPEGKVISNIATQEIIYSVRGPRAILRSFMEQDIRYLVNLDKLKPKKKNTYEIYFNTNKISLPFNVNILKVSPRMAKVTLEKEQKKSLIVVPNIIGEPEVAGRFIFEPVNNKVEVSGPKKVLSDLDEVITTAIDSTKLSGGETITVNLLKPDDRVQFKNSSSVEVKVKLISKMTTKVLSDLGIKYLSQSPIIFDDKTRAKVTMRISEEGFSALDTSNIQILAEVPNNAKGRVSVPLKVVLPDGAELVEITPKTVFVTVK